MAGAVLLTRRRTLNDRQFFFAYMMLLLLLSGAAAGLDLVRGTPCGGGALAQSCSIVRLAWVGFFALDAWRELARGPNGPGPAPARIVPGAAVLTLIAGIVAALASARAGFVPAAVTPAYQLAGNLLAPIVFGGLVLWSLARRKEGKWRRRLVACAAVALAVPAIERLLPGAHFMPLAGPVAALVLVAIGVSNDVRRRGEVHPAWWGGLIVLVIGTTAISAVADTAVGTALYRAVTAGSPGATLDPVAPPAFAAVRTSGA